MIARWLCKGLAGMLRETPVECEQALRLLNFLMALEALFQLAFGDTL